MKRFQVPGLLLLIVTMASGCLFGSDDEKDVKKGSVSGKITMIVTGEPTANVKVYLVNMDAKVDTVNYTNNRKAFVDSAVTGASGEYVITGIKPGNYGVVPIYPDTSAVYTFSLGGDSSSYRFAMNGEPHSVNFIAEKKDYPGADSDKFKIKIFIHAHNWGSYYEETLGYTVLRKYWASFVPIYDYDETSQFYLNDQFQGEITLEKPYGWTCLFYTLDNYFKIKFTNIEISLGFPIGSTPAYSEFVYDMPTNTVTRIK